MARNHGRIETGFWQNHKVRPLGDDAKMLLLYLCTSPHSTAASAYVVRPEYLTADLKWPAERVAKAFLELSRKPFALRDEVTDVVFIPGWWEHNKPENPNVAGYAAKLLLGLPDCKLKSLAIKGIREEVKFTDAIYKVLGEWSWEPSQEPLPLQYDEPSQKPLGGLFSPNRTEQNLTEPNLTEHMAQPRPKAGKGSKIPPEWTPDVDCRAYAAQRGLNQQEIDDEAKEFVAYWLSPDATKPVKRDWNGTWKRRIRDVAHLILRRRPRTTNGTHHAEPTVHISAADADQWTMRMGSFKRTGVWLSMWGPKPGEPGCEAPAELTAKPPDPGGPTP